MGVDTDLSGNLQRLPDDIRGIEFRGRQQSPRRRKRERTARPDGEHAIVRLDQLARAAHDKAMLLIRDDEQRLPAAPHAVRAPVLGELHGGPRQIRRIALELLLELLEQRESIGRGAGKAGEDLPAAQRAHLVGVGFHHGLTDRDLAVAADGDFAVAANTQNCRAMYALHVSRYARGWAW